jgi:hypothetical protein
MFWSRKSIFSDVEIDALGEKFRQQRKWIGSKLGGVEYISMEAEDREVLFNDLLADSEKRGLFAQGNYTQYFVLTVTSCILSVAVIVFFGNTLPVLTNLILGFYPFFAVFLHLINKKRMANAHKRWLASLLHEADSNLTDSRIGKAAAYSMGYYEFCNGGEDKIQLLINDEVQGVKDSGMDESQKVAAVYEVVKEKKRRAHICGLVADGLNSYLPIIVVLSLIPDLMKTESFVLMAALCLVVFISVLWSWMTTRSSKEQLLVTNIWASIRDIG